MITVYVRRIIFRTSGQLVEISKKLFYLLVMILMDNNSETTHTTIIFIVN